MKPHALSAMVLHSTANGHEVPAGKLKLYIAISNLALPFWNLRMSRYSEGCPTSMYCLDVVHRYALVTLRLFASCIGNLSIVPYCDEVTFCWIVAHSCASYAFANSSSSDYCSFFSVCPFGEGYGKELSICSSEDAPRYAVTYPKHLFVLSNAYCLSLIKAMIVAKIMIIMMAVPVSSTLSPTVAE